MKNRVYITGYASIVPKHQEETYSDVFGNRKIQRFSRRSGTLFMEAVKNALAMSEINISEINSYRTAIILGEYMNQKQDIDSIINVLKKSISESGKNVFDDGLYSAYSVKEWNTSSALANIPNIPGFLCALSLQNKGYLSTELLTCAGGLFSITEGFSKIQDGLADIAIAGGTSSKSNLLEVIKYRAMGYYSDDDYQISEGAGVVILEAESSVMKRGVKPYAEILGSANSFSPETYKTKEIDSKSVEFLLKQTMENADLNEEKPIDYITGSFSTKYVDKEIKIVKQMLKNVNLCKTAKEKWGYTFAASGVLEVVDAIEAFKARMSNNTTIISVLGIGGHNTSIAIKGVE